MRARRTALALACALLLPGAALADRRYFLETYTPALGPAGENEIELWLTTRSGKQDPREGTSLETRAEWEYGVTSRLSAAAYANFHRPPGGSLKLDSGSIELIARPVERTLPLDPALYLEATAGSDEVELEPKLLLGRRFPRWIAAVDVVGGFEFRRNREELLPDGTVLRNLAAAELTGALARTFGPHLAIGLDALARSEHPNFGPQAASFFDLGPVLTVGIGEAQLGVEVLEQIRGTPRTSGRRNLVDFEKTQVRVLLGTEL